MEKTNNLLIEAVLKLQFLGTATLDLLLKKRAFARFLISLL